MKPRLERSKDEQQIRHEAAQATKADLDTLFGELQHTADPATYTQVAAQFFWRHRDEIREECASWHFHPPGESCPEDEVPIPAASAKMPS